MVAQFWSLCTDLVISCCFDDTIHAFPFLIIHFFFEVVCTGEEVAGVTQIHHLELEIVRLRMVSQRHKMESRDLTQTAS